MFLYPWNFILLDTEIHKVTNFTELSGLLELEDVLNYVGVTPHNYEIFFSNCFSSLDYGDCKIYQTGKCNTTSKCCFLSINCVTISGLFDY